MDVRKKIAEQMKDFDRSKVDQTGINFLREFMNDVAAGRKKYVGNFDSKVQAKNGVEFLKGYTLEEQQRIKKEQQQKQEMERIKREAKEQDEQRSQVEINLQKAEKERLKELAEQKTFAEHEKHKRKYGW